jgi:hypothetical protein
MNPYIDTDYFHERQHRLLVNRKLGLKLPASDNQDQTGNHPADDCLHEA